ncbi:hypothetical protein ACHQM5_028505 [Ranunculus cassubicifolius]
MADEMVINVDESVNQPEKKIVKSKKRKRDSLVFVNMSEDEKKIRIEELKKELESLFNYFKEVSGKNDVLEEMSSLCTSIDQVIACLLEESDLPYSKLVDKIYEKVKGREGVTLVSVQNKVLFVGQRSMYGVASNADANVLEDSSDNCLWCWETRDVKLLPKAQRGHLTTRRTCRKKIQDRIAAVSAMITTLDVVGNIQNQKVDLTKASEKLAKALNEADIRLLVENLLQKSGTESAEKEAKLKEKVLVKELERNKRELEKEKKRMVREQLKEKLQNEKEQKRLQEEAEKEEKLRETEKKKQLKKQQEEAEKEQRRREKEEAQLKQQLALKKQATLMERFLKRKTIHPGHEEDSSSSKAVISDSPVKGDAETLDAVTSSMDSTFSLKDSTDISELYRSHRDAWNKVGHCIRFGNSRHWGLRQKPKTTIVKELKLQGSSETASSSKSTTANKGAHGNVDVEKAEDEWVDNIPDEKLCPNGDTSSVNIQISNRTRKLLQFDKSHRPAYYGTLSVKSDVIGPRHPLKMDSNLDYDVQSDEEWEEEDPGESLSDCEKDEEEESVVEANIKDDDEEGSEDGFMVPDGYLSDNEGVQIDSMDTDSDDDVKRSPVSKQEPDGEEFRTLFQQQKHINRLTERALQKNQPLIISNLMHEKTSLLIAQDLTGTLKLEQLFLQALSLQAFPGGPPIEISDNNTLDEDQDVIESQGNFSNSPVVPISDLLDKELSLIVSSIQSCNSGISKIIDSLQISYPAVSKQQLGNKIREVSDFVDNRWQVKREILHKLGLTITPEKRRITAFFSKRCMPPAGGPVKTDETSPQQKVKTSSEMHCQENTNMNIS